jgi:hypothetical protein
MLCTFIIYNNCFFIALCVGVCPSGSSLLSCYCFVLFYVFIPAIFFVKIAGMYVCMYVCMYTELRSGSGILSHKSIDGS